jgi:amino acid adenylation domain-containing protein
MTNRQHATQKTARSMDATDSIHAWFIRQAETTPTSLALSANGTLLSYSQLRRLAGGIARRLIDCGVRRGDLVPVFVPREQAVPAILGVLIAGAAYVPFDPCYPDTRLAALAARVNASAIITHDALAARARLWHRDAMVAVAESSDGEADPVGVAVEPDDLAYVMFTSGSTGAPKGVQVTHRNVTRLMATTAGLFDPSPSDVWTMLHSYAFDFSVWEMWGALLFGGRLVVVDDQTLRAPDELLDLLDRERVTVLSQTPSALAALIGADEQRPAVLNCLRLIVLGGERLDPATLSPWFARRGEQNPKIVNMYGITETTVHVTHRRITAHDITDSGASPIGVALPDLAVSLRNEAGVAVPAGEVGEIWVSGPGLARGYFGDTEATARAFQTVKWGPEDYRRTYLSGDLAWADADGQMYYSGRRDDQVKVRGYRIELGEVAAALKAHPDVLDACVSTDTGQSVGSRLLAWVTLRAGGTDPEPVRALAVERLPAYMVPGAIHVVDRMPLTPNGKVDRRRLVQETASLIDDQLSGAQPADRDPYTEAVARIWAEELEIGGVEATDDFFALGGHSLLVVSVVRRTRAELGVDIGARALIEAPRFADFVARIRETARA